VVDPLHWLYKIVFAFKRTGICLQVFLAQKGGLHVSRIATLGFLTEIVMCVACTAGYGSACCVDFIYMKGRGPKSLKVHARGGEMFLYQKVSTSCWQYVLLLTIFLTADCPADVASCQQIQWENQVIVQQNRCQTFMELYKNSYAVWILTHKVASFLGHSKGTATF